MSNVAISDDAPEATRKKTPQSGLTSPSPASLDPVESSSDKKWLIYLVLFGLLLLALPSMIYRHFDALSDAARDPKSLLHPFGHKPDVRHHPHKPHPAGRRKINMAEVMAEKGNGCGPMAPTFPSGKPTVVTFKTPDGTEREAVVYVPASYKPAGRKGEASPVALMLLFHGLNDDCRHFLDATGFMPYADNDGFVIASVCGSKGSIGTAWNSGTCCGFSGDQPNDVALAKQVVAELSQALCVDRERVMAVGFSNGGMLAEVLACEAPDLFRAVASVGGVVEMRPGNAEGLAACTAALHRAASTKRASVLMVHGTADVMVPWGGNGFLGFPSQEDNFKAWAERNGCSGDTNTTLSTETYTNTLYEHCRTAGENWAAAPDKVDNGVVSPAFPGRADVLPEAKRAAEQDLHEELKPEARTIPGASLEELAATLGMQKSRTHGQKHEAPNPDKHLSPRNRHHPRKHRKVDGADGPHIIDENVEHHEKDERTLTERLPRPRPHHHPHHHPHPHPHPHHHPHPHPHPEHPIGGDYGRHGKHHGHLPPPPPHTTSQHRALIPRDEYGTNQVEMVRVKAGQHRWPQDSEFSTTAYIYEFGARIFGRYR